MSVTKEFGQLVLNTITLGMRAAVYILTAVFICVMACMMGVCSL